MSQALDEVFHSRVPANSPSQLQGRRSRWLSPESQCSVVCTSQPGRAGLWALELALPRPLEGPELPGSAQSLSSALRLVPSPTRGAAVPPSGHSHLSPAPQRTGRCPPTRNAVLIRWQGLPLPQVRASFFLANAVVRAKQEDQPQPLVVVRVPENPCVQPQPVWEPGNHPDSTPSARSPRGLARAPARCVACSGCPVAVLSEHAHPVMPILHITFLFVPLNRVL